MVESGWRYYNHALIPTCAPHELPDVSVLDNQEIWNIGKPLLARWTTDFDSGKSGEWWYCICDCPFQIQSLKSKRRNVVNNAIKNCSVSICNPIEFEEELLEVFNTVQLTYPSVSRHLSDKDHFHQYLMNIVSDSETKFFLCFLKQPYVVAGYAIVKDFGSYCEYQVQKVNPGFEKYQVNAALAYAILEHYCDRFRDGFYICDGARNISHATNFQSYLEKYFGFRKAYCTLHIRYRSGVKPMISLLFPFRRILRKLDGIKAIHLVNGVLLMEECRRD